ncbi:MAG: putative ATP-dependent helicase DinG [Calditrichaeota bacterium]|nr:putative ATP-dependent helicase DinG [Calditrichota bacterium]
MFVDSDFTGRDTSELASLPAPSALSSEELARLGLNRFVAFDVETTGLDARSGRIIELGAVRFEGGREVARFSELVGIDEELPAFITRLTGISADDLAGKAPFAEHARGLVDFLAEDPVVGQNVQFDLGYLEAELDRIARDARPLPPPGDVYDTLAVARTFFPVDLSRYGLGALARQLGVDLSTAHRAADDAAATGRILVELLARARRLPPGELREMLRILGTAAFAFGSLLDGLLAIGPGSEAVWSPPVLPDNRIGDYSRDRGERKQLPEPEQVDADTYARYFAPEGTLARNVSDYQLRHGQVEMAWDVHETMERGGQLICEAGTGTGKSLAYLLPALIHARAGHGRVVISTYTRHLQNQLFDKDLPSLAAAFGGDVRAVLLKGRGNYICHRRYEALTAEPDALEGEERIAALPFVHWLNRTRTGDLSEAPGVRRALVRGLWQKLSADSGFCSNRVCRAARHCFLHRIRTSAQAADIVLINHALLFSDLASEGGVLGEYDRLIIDEAHHVEDVAANHLGFTYHIFPLRQLLLQLHDPSARRPGLLGSLKAFQRLIETPLERGDSAEDGPIDRIEAAVDGLLKSAEVFHRELDDLLRPKAEQEDGDGGAAPEYGRSVRYISGEKTFAPIENAIAVHKRRFKDLVQELDKLLDLFEDVEEGLLGGDDVLARLRSLRGDLAELARAFFALTGPPPENTVLWYTVGREPRHGVNLQAAPLDVSLVLGEMLYPKLKSLVLTSATLTVRGEFDFIRNRLGLMKARGAKYPSPFEMSRQLFISVADFLGTPKENEERFVKGVARLAYRLPTELDAGTLVLFTSQRMLAEAYDQAAKPLERAGWITFAQGVGTSQAEMLDRFRAERASVLFGVDSFWEGIDVPGESLELLLIARLPFHVPSDPLVEARSEKIRDSGGNSFIEYTVPEAILKLRQGIGRLIRRTGDYGVAVICDPRLVRSRWGKMMVDSLPVAPVVHNEYDTLFNDLLAFLEGEEA